MTKQNVQWGISSQITVYPRNLQKHFLLQNFPATWYAEHQTIVCQKTQQLSMQHQVTKVKTQHKAVWSRCDDYTSNLSLIIMVIVS